jgi:hypothetical protein
MHSNNSDAANKYLTMTKSFQCFNILFSCITQMYIISLSTSFLNSSCFSFLYASLNSKDDAFVIFRDAALYNMTDAGHVWIVTEQALLSNNTPIGTLGLKLNNDNETEHIRVSMTFLLRLTFKKLFWEFYFDGKPDLMRKLMFSKL